MTNEIFVLMEQRKTFNARTKYKQYYAFNKGIRLEVEKAKAD